MKIAFRVDAHPNIGYGHFIRCIALAQRLQVVGEIHFYTSQPDKFILEQLNVEGFKFTILPEVLYQLPEPSLPDTEIEMDQISLGINADWVVLDGYWMGLGWEKYYQSKGIKVFRIDDLNNRTYSADIILNPGICHHPYNNTTLYSKTFIGLEYSLVRSDFFDKNTTSSLVNNSFLLLLGTGACKNDYLNIIHQLPEDTLITCVTSFDLSKETKNVTSLSKLGISDLISELDKHETIICSPSGVALEALVRRKTISLVQFTNNQSAIQTGLNQIGVENFPNISNQIKFPKFLINSISSQLW